MNRNIKYFYRKSVNRKLPSDKFILTLEYYNEKIVKCFNNYEKNSFRKNFHLQKSEYLSNEINNIKGNNIFTKKYYYADIRKKINEIISNNVNNGDIDNSFITSENHNIISQYFLNLINILSKDNIITDVVKKHNYLNIINDHNIDLEHYKHSLIDNDGIDYIKDIFLDLYAENYGDKSKNSIFLKELDGFFTKGITKYQDTEFYIYKIGEEVVLTFYICDLGNNKLKCGGLNGSSKMKGKGVYFDIFNYIINLNKDKNIFIELGYEINGKINFNLGRLIKKYLTLGFKVRYEIGFSKGAKVIYMIKK